MKDPVSRARTNLCDKFFRTYGFDSLIFFRKSFYMIATWLHTKIQLSSFHKNTRFAEVLSRVSTLLHGTFVDIDVYRNSNL